MSTRTWETNAREYGLLARQGKDFRLALLAATSCTHNRAVAGKTNIADFARVAGTTPARVNRHLQAWEKLSYKGLVLNAGDMHPQDVDTFKATTDILVQFTNVYDATASGGRPRASVNEITTRMDADDSYLYRVLSSLSPDAVRKATDVLLSSPSQDPYVAPDATKTTSGSCATRRAETRADRLEARFTAIADMLTTVVESVERGEQVDDLGDILAVFSASLDNMGMLLDRLQAAKSRAA